MISSSGQKFERHKQKSLEPARGSQVTKTALARSSSRLALGLSLKIEAHRMQRRGLLRRALPLGLLLAYTLSLATGGRLLHRDLATSADSSPDSSLDGTDSEPDESAASDHQQSADGSLFMDHHNSQMRAMHDLFERRQMNNLQLQAQGDHLGAMGVPTRGLGLGQPSAPFPLSSLDQQAGHKQTMDPAGPLDGGMGVALPFGLGPSLPQLLGFQSVAFDGPQRGDQSAHANHHHVAMPSTDSEVVGPKKYPQIFRFADGRINLSEFEKQKKIRLSNKNHMMGGENHIESSAPIMFDGRQLKRTSFLILHGGVFSR